MISLLRNILLQSPQNGGASILKQQQREKEELDSIIKV